MADLKKKKRRKKTTTNESLNSHLLPANVAGRLTVLPANCKIHPHLARGQVLISGPASAIAPHVYVCLRHYFADLSPLSLLSCSLYLMQVISSISRDIC